MRHYGFSLVELSIVLVIVGLLVGGVLAGKSLIRAAEIRGVVMEADKYKTSWFAFRDRYLALPGDMTNATSFWGIAAGTGSDTTCKQFLSTDMATCNGNGNGQVENPNPEQFRFWQHLANAGLIEGQFTGRSDNGNVGQDGHRPGSNCPKSKFGRAGWAVRFQTGAGPGQNKHTYMIGNPQPNYDDMPGLVFLKPEEAWNVDTKGDDGMPFTGRIAMNQWSTCTDAPNSTTYTGNYLLTSDTVGCALKVIMD